MITENEIFPIGKILKPHGVRGEILFSYSSDVFENEYFKYFILEIDGILVPFFINEYRINSAETAFVKLDGIDSENDAKFLTAKVVFAPKKFLEKVKTENIGLDYFIDFQIIDKKNDFLGKIYDIDQTTANVLMIVQTANDEILIPFSENYIIDIDHNTKKIFVDLPQGLIELQEK
ncbi:MAG: ribosome maturation factor RimM [Paludibacter sp.]|nr:ribosome maturation factor RimM [Paludibacter sp.]